MNDLLELGVRSVPVVTRGREYVFAQELADVSKFLGKQVHNLTPLDAADRAVLPEETNLIVLGDPRGLDVAADSVGGDLGWFRRNGGAILLFAFTYLWVAYNQYANAGGRALGWYSAFVTVTAIVFGVYTVQNTPDSNTADLWLAGNWFAWAILWAMFLALLALDLPIARITGWVAILEGIGTAWALAIAILEGKLAF